MSRAIYVASLLLALGGCSSAEERAAQHSAAQIARGIEVLRNAPNPAKAEPLGALAKLACVGQDVCKTRDTCLRGYKLHVDSISLTAAAKMMMAQGDTLDAAKVLGAAERKLNDAKDQVGTCADLEAALRRHYKL